MEINEFGDSKIHIMWRPGYFFGGIILFKEGKAQKLVFTGGKRIKEVFYFKWQTIREDI